MNIILPGKSTAIRFLNRFHFPVHVIGIISVLAVAVSALFITAPKNDDFSWADPATHALNGAFLHDYFWTATFAPPLEFAYKYFLHYPALTISLYPPLFPVTEAIVFSFLGVSHFAAQLTVAIFGLILVYSVYSTARTAFPPVAAGGAALLVVATPEIAFCSRQVVLEIPSLSLLVVATALFLRFFQDHATKRLYLSVLFLCAAIYTKQTASFAIIPFGATLLIEKGWFALRERSSWLAVLLGFFLLFPLAVFTVFFASHNLDIVAGLGPEAGSSFAISSFLIYARLLPVITGSALIAAALGYLALVSWKGWRSPEERRLTIFMILWFVVDYLMISVIAHREERYGIFLTVPVAILAVALIQRVLPQALASGTAFIFGAFAFMLVLASDPVPRVQGYDDVAAFVINHAQKNSVILFHGYRSPNFVFAMRAQSASPDFYVLRSEKMMRVDYKVTREWGIHDRGQSLNDVEQLVDRYGIEYVVFQPDFWTDLPSMAVLQDLVYSDRFTKVAEFPITANTPTDEKTIVVFRNKRPTHPVHPNIDLNMPLIGSNISEKY